MALSETAKKILSAAAQRTDGLIECPSKLPAAARNAVIRSLLKQDLVTEVAASAEQRSMAWRQDEGGDWMAVRISDAGLKTVAPDLPVDSAGADRQVAQDDPRTGGTGDHALPSASHDPVAPPASEHAQNATVAGPGPNARATLRQAAQALLDAWDGLPEPKAADVLDGPIAALRAHLARAPARGNGGSPRRPREDTKQQKVLALLSRTEGVSGPAIMEVTGWAPHTVRGFLAGLKKKSHRDRGPGAGAAGRAEQGRGQGQLHDLSRSG